MNDRFKFRYALDNSICELLYINSAENTVEVEQKAYLNFDDDCGDKLEGGDIYEKSRGKNENS